MLMRSCLFASDNSLRTLCTQPGKESYIVYWQHNTTNGGVWDMLKKKQVHNKPCSGMRASTLD